MSGEVFDQQLLFKDMDARQCELVRPLFYSCSLCAGSILFTQGEESDYLYLVIEGEVTVRYKPEDGPSLVVGHIRPGGVVGWSAALGTPVYGSEAVCDTDCHLLRIHNADLRSLYHNHPETASLILERLASALTRRLQTTHSQVITLLQRGLSLTGKPGEGSKPHS